MGKLLSIIIPTYNMEKYLRKCLDSLIVSEENMKSLEVLIVNDGSKDSSSTIAHEYETMFPETFYVIDKENGNYGSCINSGLRQVTGKYVKILDADDSYIKDLFDIYMSQLKFIDEDLVLTEYNMVDSEDNVIHHIKFEYPQNTPFEINDIYFIQSLRMHAITYKTQLFRNFNYHQSEGISYTDIEWSFIPLMKVKTVRYIPICIYNYLIGREGQTVDPQVMLKSLWMTRKVFDTLLESFQSTENRESNAKHIVYKKLIDVAVHNYLYALKTRDKDALKLVEDFDTELKNTCHQLYDDLNKIILHKFLRCHYIDDWRKNPNKKYSYWALYIFMQRTKTIWYSLKAKF